MRRNNPKTADFRKKTPPPIDKDTRERMRAQQADHERKQREKKRNS